MAKLRIRTLAGALLALSGSIACIQPAQVQAQEPHPMTFDGYVSPMPAIMGTAWTIFGDGVIDEGTTERLQKFLNDHDVPYSSSLYLNSPGGSLAEGLKLGRFIRQSQLFTEVARSGDKLYDIKSGECYSACAIAFLGGPYRFHEKGSIYGVHRFYASSKGGTLNSDEAQIISAAIIEYIRQMGVDPSLFTFMTEAGADDIKPLSEADQIRLNVVNNGEEAAVMDVGEFARHPLPEGNTPNMERNE